MFLKISRDDFSWSRSQKALPLFFLLWAGGLLLCLLSLLTLRAHLHSLERAQAEKLLDLYLALDRSASTFFNSQFLPHERMLQGLTFVRVLQGRDQMLAVGDQFGSLNFKGLMGLDPAASGVWLEVGRGGMRNCSPSSSATMITGCRFRRGWMGDKATRSTRVLCVGRCVSWWQASWCSGRWPSISSN